MPWHEEGFVAGGGYAPPAASVVPSAKQDQDELELSHDAAAGDGSDGTAAAGPAVVDAAAQGETRWVALPEGQNFGRVGAVRALRTPVLGVVFIGPHWYCSIVMLAFVLAVGCFFVSKVATRLGWPHLIAGVVCTAWSTKAFLECALADPGIVPPDPIKALGDKESKAMPMQLLPSTGSRHCKACMIVQPKGCNHCEWCRVCVAGWDHHCPWMNKCIGRQNMAAFRCFLFVSLPSLAYMVIAVILSPAALS